MVIIDTCIIIDHLRKGKLSGPSVLRQFSEHYPQEQLSTSLVTIQELFEGQSSKDPEKENELLLVISELKQLPVTYEIARLAGTLTRDSKQPLEFADAAIAATALYHQADLFTLNEKDFKEIQGISLRSIN